MNSFISPVLQRIFARQSLAQRRRPKCPLRRRALALAEALEQRLVLATFTVLNASDSGAGSFRQAIMDSVGVATDDTINFGAFFNSPRTISLLTALPAIAAGGGGLTITGPGASLLTIRRDPGASAFRVLSSTAPTLNISGVTVSGGNPADFGGGLFASAGGNNVTLDSVVFTGNTTTSAGGGAVCMSTTGFLTVRNSTLTANSCAGFGGAIDFIGGGGGGSLLIENSTISGNTAGSSGPGGAFYFGGNVSATPPAGFVPNTIVVRNSILLNNTTPSEGGGIALRSFTGTLLVQNSTITGNTASTSGGGIAMNSGSGTITVQNSTIRANTATTTPGGGGIARSSPTIGDINVVSSVVSGNNNASAPDILASAQTTTNVNFSAVGNNNGFTLSNNSTDNLAFGTNLLLSALGNFGGPTQAFLPTVSSPLINAGSNPAGLTTDQRGGSFVRVSGGQADIGAIEVQSQNFLVTNANDSAAGSLRAAIINANLNGPDDTILFDTAGVFASASTISLLSALPTFASNAGNLTITGTGAANLTVRRDPAAGTFRVFDSLAPTFTLTGMTVTGGNATSDGGGIQIGSNTNAIFDGVIVRGNRTTQDGGGISLSTGAFLTIRNSIVSGNSCGRSGGGIYFFQNGSLLMENCTLSGNTAASATVGGGGLYFFGSASATPPVGFIPNTLLIRNSTIDSNVSANDGGGIVLPSFAGTLLLQNSTISGNTAAASGGGAVVRSGSGSITAQNCTITGNSAGANAPGTGGGGLARTSISAGSITVVSSVVSGNLNGTAPDILGVAGTTTVNVNNSAVGSAIGFTPSGSSGSNLAFNIDLKLGNLQLNGGPTRTHAPLIGSPLINAGSNPAALTTDQRGPGFARVSGALADIGALEVQNTLLVTNDNDSGAGSLRDAIAQANASAAFDTIQFDPTFFGVARTISLLGALPDITDDVAIDGPGSPLLTLSAAGFRVFICDPETSFNLSGMTLTGGSGSGDGGAIFANFGCNLTLDGLLITGNSASSDGAAIGLDDNCFLTLRNSTVSGNVAGDDGGGIYFFQDGSLVIENSTISGNQATSDDGGGIYFFGVASSSPPVGFIADTIVIRNSTITSNTAAGDGGGIVLINFEGTLLVQNSTLTANSAGGSFGGGGISRNSGGGIITIANSIVSGNTSAPGPDIRSTGTVNANFSAIGSATGFALSGTSGNNLAFGASLMLGTLSDNGGPTRTIAPALTSPLVNAGSNALAGFLTTDQRGTGFLRLAGNVDIGAFEIQPHTFVVTNLNNSGTGSLRQVVAIANSNPSADSIVFLAGLLGTITLTSGEIPISEAVTILGPSAASMTVNGNDTNRAFNTSSALAGSAINIFSLTFANCRASGGTGGAILGGDEALTLNACVVTGNTAGFGGGIAVSGGGTLTLNDCIISSNNATSNIAGIDVFGGASSKLIIRRSTISGNTAVGDTGGIYAFSYLFMENSTVSGNTASTSAGGGISLDGTFAAGALVIRNSTISGNTSNASSGGSGAGICFFGGSGTLQIFNSTITGNTANGGGAGGGIARAGGTFTINISNSLVSGNNNTAAPDIFSAGTVNVNFSAIGSATGFTLTGGNNLPFGTNLMLGALLNNGGPTLTHLPAAGSPLLGAGSNALVPVGITTDQRGTGFARISGTTVDIGSVERDIVAPSVVGSSVFDFDARPQSLNYTFSENVGPSLSTADLVLQNLTTSTTIPTANIAVSYDSMTNTARFTFPGFTFGALPDGNYRATLLGGGVTDPSGNPLASDNISFFFFLQGDANRDTRVNLIDFNILAGNFGIPNRVFSQADFNYDGVVTLIDFNIIAGRFGNFIAPDNSIQSNTRGLPSIPELRRRLPALPRFSDTRIGNDTLPMKDLEDLIAGTDQPAA